MTRHTPKAIHRLSNTSSQNNEQNIFMNRFKSFLKFTFCHSCRYRFLFFLSAERSDPFHPTAIANANDHRVIFMRTRAFEKFLLKQRPRRSRDALYTQGNSISPARRGARIFCFGRDDTARKINDPRFSNFTRTDGIVPG